MVIIDWVNGWIAELLKRVKKADAELTVLWKGKRNLFRHSVCTQILIGGKNCMVSERKIRCDCGDYFEESDTKVYNFATKGMICPGCGYRTFTIDQAKEILKLMKLKELVKSKKKIIRIGNSKGITLPQGLKANIGDVAVMEVVSPDSFLIKIKSAAKH